MIVTSFIDENKVDICCFQETWLDEGDDNIIAEIKEYGYKVFKLSRTSGRGGGLAVLFKPYLKMKLLSLGKELKFESLKFICCSLSLKSKKIILINLYRQPAVFCST